MIKIVITEDHKMFRESLRTILLKANIAKVIGEASNGKELLELLPNVTPDIILMDISMPVMDGVEASRLVTEKYPEMIILALSSFSDAQSYYKMTQAGVKGFVLKSSSLDELELAINEVYNNRSWFSQELLQNVIKEQVKVEKKVAINDLSERELEVIGLICEGDTNNQIAEALNLSVDTVKWHRANIMSKTGCTNAASLVIYAIKNKIINFE